jgi:hypothetical protein
MDSKYAVGIIRSVRRQRPGSLIRALGRGVVGLIICAIFNEPGFAAEPSTPPSLFASPDYGTVLGFDLRNERAPVATVVINRSGSGQNTAVDLALPFQVNESSSNEDALFRVGTFNQWTLVTFADDALSHWPQQISFFPITDNMPDPPPQNTALPGSLYFQSEGQVWRFLYRYPDPKRSKVPAREISRLSLRPFEAIAVAIPQNASRLEVRGTEHFTENEYARFYPPTPTSQTEPFLEIEYLLPPTSRQLFLLKNVAKFIGAFAPLLGIFFAYLARRRPIWRFAFIVLTVIVYIALLALVIKYAPLLGDTGNDSMIDFGLLGVSGIFAIIGSLRKGEETGAPTKRLPLPTQPR